MRNGLNMMKYAVRHHERFNNVNMGFLIAFLHTVSCFLLEFTVILVLLSLQDVLQIIMKYVSLSAISNIPRFYYNSLYDNELLKIAGHHSLELKHFRRDQEKKEKKIPMPFSVKVMRVI